jgi:hypothetical protein
MTEDTKSAWKTFTEEIEVAGSQLVEEVNRLVAEGNVRKLQIRSEKGDVYLSVPLTAGAIAGGVVAVAAPWLAVIGAIAGLVGKVKIEIARANASEPEAQASAQVPPAAEDKLDA